MNSTNCSIGWARDEVWLLPFQREEEYGDECNVSLVLYCVLFVVVILAKICFSFLMMRAWCIRHHRIMTSNDAVKIKAERNRLPLIPSSVLMSTVAYIVLFLTTITNVANISNGIPYMIYGFGWMLCDALGFFYLLKIVSLGGKLAMFNFRPKGPDNLMVMNSFQKLLSAAQLVALVGQSVIFIVIVPIFPNEVRAVQAGLACQAIAPGLQGFAAAYHMERVVNMVKKMQLKRGVSPNDSSSSPHKSPESSADADIRNAVFKLRSQQIIIIAAAFPFVMLAIVQTALVLPTYWFLFYIAMWVDVLLNFGFYTTNTRGRKYMMPSPGVPLDDSRSSSKNNNQVQLAVLPSDEVTNTY